MDRTTCPKCHTPIDDPHLIRCLECGTIFSQYEQSQQIQHELLTTNKEALIRELKKETLKSLIGWIFLGLSIIGAIAGWGLFQIYWGLQTLVTNRIAAQFEEPRIRASLTEVAENRASKIIEDQLNPAINEAKKTINDLQGELRRDVNTIRDDFKKELETLRHMADIQKNIHSIQRLQLFAEKTCDIESYNRLTNYIKEDNDEAVEISAYNAAQSVLNTYRRRTWSDTSLMVTLPDGSKIPMKDLPPSELISYLEDDNWRIRSTAAFLLGNQKICNSPEALLKVIRTDESMCVKADAMRALNQISERHFDAFDFEKAQKWHTENREKVRQKLQCKEG